MKTDFCKLLFLVSIPLFFGCGGGSEPETPPVQPPATEKGSITFTVTYNASDGTPMRVGYYLFDAAGKALAYTDKAGKTQTLHWVEGKTLAKASAVSVETPAGTAEGYTVVALAYPTGNAAGISYNANAGQLQDNMVTPGEAAGEYFTGRATLGSDGNAQVSLKRATGRMAVTFDGPQEALDAVVSAEVVLTGDSFTGGMHCDGTLTPLGREGKIGVTSGSWSCPAMPSMQEPVNGGTVRIHYRRPGETDLRTAEMPLENKHGFSIRANMQTRLTVTLEMAANGELSPALTIATAWIEGSGDAADESDGVQKQFYYTFVKEVTFATNAANPTNSATASNGTALAVYGDYFYIPTGTWDFTVAKRKLIVDIWSISRKKKVGTIATPQASEGSFCYAVQTLYVSGSKLFIGHGLMDVIPPYLAPIARVDVFDLAATPEAPSFLTSIGGGIYNPYIENAEYAPANNAKIAEPLAVYEKDGKLLVLDYYRFNVFNSSDLTPEKSGDITQTCFLPKAVEGSLNAAGFFVCDGELYVTDPAKTGEGGLRRVSWEAVLQGNGPGLLDAGPALLKGVPATKVVAADDGYFVFSNVEKGTMQRYDKAWNFVSDCNSYFATVTNGKYTNTTGKVSNAVPLPTPDDKMPRLLMRDGSNVVLVRIERHYITEF